MIQDRETLSEPFIAIYLNGKQLGENMMKYVSELEVEEAEKKSSIARITVEDIDGVWLEDKSIKKEVPITIRGGHRKNHRVLLFGKISGVEANLPQEGIPRITISAVDRGAQALNTVHSRSWKNMKISDVIKKILSDCGYTAEVDDSGVKLPVITQRNETNGEFIKDWCKKMKWNQLRTPSGKYYVGKKTKNNLSLETISYKTGGLEINNFAPFYSEKEKEGDED
jgi:phage protein D